MANVLVRAARATLCILRGILVQYCMLTTTALLMLLFAVLVVPLRLCVPGLDRRMEEALQSVWVLMLLGSMDACSRTRIIVTIDEGPAGYAAYRRLAFGYAFEGAQGEEMAARYAAELAAQQRAAAAESCVSLHAAAPDDDSDASTGSGRIPAPNAEGASSECGRKAAPPNAECASGDASRDNESDLVIANHQMYLDWAYVWSLLLPIGREGTLKIILKASLAYVPVYGLGVRLVRFVLLSRNWDVDRTTIGRRLRRLPYPGVPFSLLVFPEGTTMCAKAVEATRRYAARSAGRHEMPRFTLIPRVTGTQFALQQLGARLDGVLDLTIGYTGIGDVAPDGALRSYRYPEDTYGPGDVFFRGRGPGEVHIHVRYAPMDAVPYAPAGWARDCASSASGASLHSSVDSVSPSLSSRRACPPPDADTFRTTPEFEEWMYARFREKDALMAAFYRDGRFPGVRSVRTRLAPVGALVGLVFASALSTVFFWSLGTLLYMLVASLFD